MHVPFTYEFNLQVLKEGPYSLPFCTVQNLHSIESTQVAFKWVFFFFLIEGNEKEEREESRRKRGGCKRVQLQGSSEYDYKKLALSSVEIWDESSYLT